MRVHRWLTFRTILIRVEVLRDLLSHSIFLISVNIDKTFAVDRSFVTRSDFE